LSLFFVEISNITLRALLFFSLQVVISKIFRIPCWSLSHLGAPFVVMLMAAVHCYRAAVDYPGNLLPGNILLPGHPKQISVKVKINSATPDCLESARL